MFRNVCGITQIGIVIDILSAAAAVVSSTALLSKQKKNHRCIFLQYDYDTTPQ